MRAIALVWLVGCGCGRLQFDRLAADEEPRLALGYDFTCLLRSDGTVSCWGNGVRGRLGTADVMNLGDDETPGAARIMLGGVATQITGGTDHACARLETGAVRCWGAGEAGKLGYQSLANIGDDEHPASAGDVEVGGRVEEVAAGGQQTCARLDTGAVRCWGNGGNGRLGYGNVTSIGDDEPPAVAGDLSLGEAALQIRSRGSHSCALLVDATVRCWGAGANGQLGYANTLDVGDDESPEAAGPVPIGGPVVQIAVGAGHTCALLETGAVRCWGNPANGRLGYANAVRIGDDEPPEAAGDVPLGARAVQIATGASHTCARLASGAVRCWGLNDAGQLGYANTANIGDDEPPAAAGDVPLGGRAVEIVTGGTHTCARLTTGAVRCWGDGAVGQLGYGMTVTIGDDETPAMAGDVPLD